jgi:PST family polysaccharide transporter
VSAPQLHGAAPSHTGRQILQNSFWLMLEQGLRIAAGIVVAALIARYVGARDFGLFNYALSLVAFLSAAVGLGLDTIVIRELNSRPGERRWILGSALVLRLVAGLAATALAPLLVLLLQPGDRTALLLTTIIAFTLPLQAIDTLELPFHAELKSRIAVASRSVGVFGTLAARAVLLAARAKLEWFAAAALVEKPLGAVILVRRLHAAGQHVRNWRYDRQFARRLLRDGWPLVVSGLCIIVYMRSDQILITRMLGPSANGVYSAAVRLVEQMFVIPGIFARSLAPKAVQLGDAEFLPYVRRVAARMVWAGIGLTVAMEFASGPLIELLYGDLYKDAAPVLRLLSLNIVFLSYSAARSMIVVRHNLFKFDTLFISVSALANLTLNYILIPRYGIEGAVAGSIVAQAGMLVALPLLHSRTRLLGTTFFGALLGVGMRR